LLCEEIADSCHECEADVESASMSEAKRVCAADSRQRQQSIRVRAGNFESAKTSTYSLADDTGLNDGVGSFINKETGCLKTLFTNL